MKQEEKQLLLKDLSARLPYGLQTHIINDEYDDGFQSGEFDNTLRYHHLEAFVCDRIEIKPYLRPMSSMTEEEKEEYYTVIIQSQGCSFENGESATTMVNDWLLSKHFDTRGLIPRRLAIAVTEENNPYE